MSRQAGREARAAFAPRLAEITPNEEVLIDFTGLLTFSPSWGDEFLTPLHKEFESRLILKDTENPSVRATIDILEKSSGKKFRVVA